MSKPDPYGEAISGSEARIVGGIALLCLGFFTCFCCGGLSGFGDCGGPPDMLRECLQSKDAAMKICIAIGTAASIAGICVLAIRAKES